MLYGAMNFPVRPVLSELDTVANLGFDYFELTMDPPQAHHEILSGMLDNLLESLRQHDMGLVCHLPTFLSTADLTPALREASLTEMIKSLNVAAALHPLKVVLHPSYLTGLAVFVPDQAKRYARSAMEAIVEEADRLGLTLCLENMFPRSNSLVEPADFTEVFQQFPTLKLTLDTGHAHIGSAGGRRILDFLRTYPDRVAHIHASDNFGKDDNHLPIGAGTIDFTKIIKLLKEIGYDGTITLEIFSKDKDYLKIGREKLDALVRSL